MQQFSPNIRVMRDAVRKAASRLVRDFGEVENLQVSRKGPSEFVTNADLKSEEILINELKKSRPKYGFLVEESGVIEGEDEQYRWIIDPLDGTTNFLHGNPQFSISVGLAKKTPIGKEEIISAIIAAPAYGEIYWAERGQGAWCESDKFSAKRLRVSNRNNILDALLAVGSLRHADIDSRNIFMHLANDSAGLRSVGSTALGLAYTAAGRFDGFFQKNARAWDVAAGILLVKEAGGFVSDLTGGDEMLQNGSIIAGNEKIHEILLRQFKPKK